jgi:dethiobiotin synthetase
MTRRRSILITGTDTGVGKTIICRYLAAYLKSRGLNVVTQKWVQTDSKENDDIHEHNLTLPASASKMPNLKELRCPYSFILAASPHLAAQNQGVKIKAARIEETLCALEQHFDMVLVEGSGGALVPLSEKLLLADMAACLEIPTLIVTANRLGAINHTLLTAEALTIRGVTVMGLIFNRIEKNGNEKIFNDNIRIIGHFSRVPVLGEMPFLTGTGEAQAAFEHIGAAFFSQWSKKNK